MQLHRQGNDLTPPAHRGHWLARQYACRACDALFEIEEGDIGALAAIRMESDTVASVACPSCRTPLRIEKLHADAVPVHPTKGYQPFNEHLRDNPGLIYVIGDWKD